MKNKNGDRRDPAAISGFRPGVSALPVARQSASSAEKQYRWKSCATAMPGLHNELFLRISLRKANRWEC